MQALIKTKSILLIVKSLENPLAHRKKDHQEIENKTGGWGEAASDQFSFQSTVWSSRKSNFHELINFEIFKDFCCFINDTKFFAHSFDS